MQNQMEKSLENEMDIGVYQGYQEFSSSVGRAVSGGVSA